MYLDGDMVRPSSGKYWPEILRVENSVLEQNNFIISCQLPDIKCNDIQLLLCFELTNVVEV